MYVYANGRLKRQRDIHLFESLIKGAESIIEPEINFKSAGLISYE